MFMKLFKGQEFCKLSQPPEHTETSGPVDKAAAQAWKQNLGEK